MQSEGYVLMYVKDKSIDYAISVAGYRIMNMLYCGKIIYIDDLVTDKSQQGKGYAKRLLSEIFAIAKIQNCESVHLDSGFLRTDAHKLYLNNNFKISALHFGKAIK